jgi:hypothetical protein
MTATRRFAAIVAPTFAAYSRLIAADQADTPKPLSLVPDVPGDDFVDQ